MTEVAVLMKQAVFILCVDSILKNHTAICITYFPNSRQVFGLYMGYTTGEEGYIGDVPDMISRLVQNRDFLDNPFLLISAFLEIDQKHRFKHVNDMVNESYKRLRSAPGLESHGSTSLQDEIRTRATSHDFNSRLGTLRMQLSIWSVQLQRLLVACEKLPEFDQEATEGIMLDPQVYITGVIDTYEEHVLRCDSMLKVMSLAFQKVSLRLVLVRKEDADHFWNLGVGRCSTHGRGCRHQRCEADESNRTAHHVLSSNYSCGGKIWTFELEKESPTDWSL